VYLIGSLLEMKINIEVNGMMRREMLVEDILEKMGKS